MSPDEEKGTTTGNRTDRSGHSESAVATLKNPTEGRVAPPPKSVKSRKNAGRRNLQE